MIISKASPLNIYVCVVGHISNEAIQERSKRTKLCVKEKCWHQVEQVREEALRNIHRSAYFAGRRRAQKEEAAFRLESVRLLTQSWWVNL